MLVEKRFPDGAWIVSSIVNGFSMRRVYMGYTKREAIRLYREEIKRCERKV